MTVSNQTAYVTAQGNGSNKVWPYAFQIPVGTEIVTIWDPVGGTVQLTPSQYTITGAGSPTGGTVTYPLSGPAIGPTFTITIKRILPMVQTLDLSSQGSFYPSVIEDALDYLTMLYQQTAAFDNSNIAPGAAIDATKIANGMVSNAEFQFLDGATSNIQAQINAIPANVLTFTNKTIDANVNTISNIDNSEIKAGAAIDATKIANGSVTSAQFQFLSGATSNIQTQINAISPSSGPGTAPIAPLTPAADRIAYYTGAASAALTPLTAFARTVIDDPDAATWRATVGLGTAAVENVGTTGHVIPFTDGTNIWTAQNTSTITGAGGFNWTLTKAIVTTFGPAIRLQDLTPTPNVSDIAGQLQFDANDAAGTLVNSASIIRVIYENVTAGLSDFILDFRTVRGGAASVSRMSLRAGLQMNTAAGAAPAGGDKGAGTINVATALYENGTALTAKYGQLSANNNWTGIQTISTTLASTVITQWTSSADSSAPGPLINLARTRVSTPTVGDQMGAITFNGFNDALANKEYGRIIQNIGSPVAGAEYGIIRIQTMDAGASGVRFSFGRGLFSNAVTGGDKGVDTINAITYYENNVALTAKYGQLAVANTWTGVQTISVTTSGFAFSVTSSDSTAASGPDINLVRASSAPAAGNVLGRIVINGRNTALTGIAYVIHYTTLSDPTPGSESAAYSLLTYAGGVQAGRLNVGSTGGVYIGAPTAPDKGPGNLNAIKLWENGVDISVKYAPLASPALTGTPTAPTVSPSTDNSTKIATTAFVQSAVAASVAGVASFNTRTGAVTLTLADVTTAGGAPIDSPTFTTTAAAPTPATADNTTKIATTAYVRAQAGVNLQAFDATLTSIAALGTAADKLAYTTGVDTWAETAFTSFARTVVDDVDAATMRGTLGLANSATIATGTSGATIPLLNGTNTWANAQTFSVSPIAPTPAAADNSTKVATTAFVATSFAPLAGPLFTGDPRSTTAPPAGDNDTSIPTTAWVQTEIAPLTPIGSVLPWAGIGAAPSKWLLCYGQAVSRATYSALFAAVSKSSTVTITIASPGIVTWNAHGLGNGDPVTFRNSGGNLPTGIVAGTVYYALAVTTNTFQISATPNGTAINTSGTQAGTQTCWYTPYGQGDGSTTFNVPDMRGRTVFGKDNMGGTASSPRRMDNPGNGQEGIDGLNLGNAGGQAGHTQTVPELVSHQHVTGLSALMVNSGGSQPRISSAGTDINSLPTGGGLPFNVTNPGLILNYIIYAGV